MKLRKGFIVHNTKDETFLVPTGGSGFSGLVKGNETLGEILRLLGRETSEADILIKKDLDIDYPATAREVLKLYARITKCIYNEEVTDEQIVTLVQQVRKLYADALLDNNGEDEQIALIKGDIQNYRKENKIIYSYAIDSANNINVIQTKAGKTALIKMYFTLRAGASMDRAFEEFSMLEEENGRWKIAGWRPAEEKSLN